MRTKATVSVATDYPHFMTLPVTPIERGFRQFHAANPHVYAALKDLALRGYRAGIKRFGIGSLVETLRFNAQLQTKGDAYKINNNYRALYARLLLVDHPELRGMMEIRERPSVPQYADA